MCPVLHPVLLEEFQFLVGVDEAVELAAAAEFHQDDGGDDQGGQDAQDDEKDAVAFRWRWALSVSERFPPGRAFPFRRVMRLLSGWVLMREFLLLAPGLSSPEQSSQA